MHGNLVAAAPVQDDQQLHAGHEQCATDRSQPAGRRTGLSRAGVREARPGSTAGGRTRLRQLEGPVIAGDHRCSTEEGEEIQQLTGR
jgi:hypothetical protein